MEDNLNQFCIQTENSLKDERQLLFKKYIETNGRPKHNQIKREVKEEPMEPATPIELGPHPTDGMGATKEKPFVCYFSCKTFGIPCSTLDHSQIGCLQHTHNPARNKIYGR